MFGGVILILTDFLSKVFADVIEYRDIGDKIIIIKHNRPGVEIKRGSNIRVRKDQNGIILNNESILTTLRPGAYSLLPETFPSFKTLFNKGYKSFVNIDLYILNTKTFSNTPWSNKSPITLIDRDFSFLQLRAFGTYSFKIVDSERFINEIFINKKKYFTCNMLLYIAGFVARAVEECIYESGLVLTDLIRNFKGVEGSVIEKLKHDGNKLGIEYIAVCIDNLSIPALIEQMIEDNMWKEIESRYKHS